MWWGISLLLLTTAVSYLTTPPVVPALVDASIPSKLAYYRQHKADYDLILLGDSLTFTGLHPEFIDPELGTHSINMAIFAHWFATQYPFIKDLVPEIPRHTRVLWSIHAWDFDDHLTVQHVYPVGLVTAVRYWTWGATNSGLLDNVLYYNRLTRFFVDREELRASLISLGDENFQLPRLISSASAMMVYPTVPNSDASTSPNLVDTPQLREKLTDYYGKLPFVARVEPTADSGRINSVVLHLKGGGYYRIELAPEFFREKQREMASKSWHPSDAQAKAYEFSPLAPASMKMFKAGLAAFRDAGISVTVNVMEEAPYTFGNEIIKTKLSGFLDAALRPIVEGYGDDYIHADYSSFTDSDYFDYNHLNSAGIAKYTPLLISQLQQTAAFAHAVRN